MLLSLSCFDEHEVGRYENKMSKNGRALKTLGKEQNQNKTTLKVQKKPVDHGKVACPLVVFQTARFYILDCYFF